MGLRTTDRLWKWEADKHIVGFGVFSVDNNKYIDLSVFYFKDGDWSVLCVYFKKIWLVDLRSITVGG